MKKLYYEGLNENFSILTCEYANLYGSKNNELTMFRKNH